MDSDRQAMVLGRPGDDGLSLAGAAGGGQGRQQGRRRRAGRTRELMDPAAIFHSAVLSLSLPLSLSLSLPIFFLSLFLSRSLSISLPLISIHQAETSADSDN